MSRPTRFRTHFARLPLQISHFDRLFEVPACLGIPDERLSANMDAEGHIWIDLDQLGRLGRRLREDLSEARLADIRERHCARLGATKAIVEKAADAPLSLREIGDLCDHIAGLAPYGIVTKVLPDSVRDLIRSKLHERGVELTDARRCALLVPQDARSLDLARACLAAFRRCHENAAERAAAIEVLCARSCGAGPRDWAAPGYESPAYASAELDRQFAGLDRQRLDELETRLVLRDRQRREAASALRRAIGRDLPVDHLLYWLAFLDEQTTVMRWAFLRGLRPSLHRLAERWSADGRLEDVDDLLFLTRHEIVRGPDDSWKALVRERRERDPELVDEPTPRANAEAAPLVLRGTPAGAPHTVTGPACVAHSASATIDVPKGAILVVPHVTPDMSPLFWRIAGVVVEGGGLMQHATTLAREFSLPCVVGAHRATTGILQGATIELDGRSGVTRVLG